MLRTTLIAAVMTAVAGLTGVSTLTPDAAGAAEPAPLPKGTVFTITGHGWGHGHGMSQYGARGAAAEGLTYRQIVRFYYPGTKHGTAAGKVAVLIAEDTSRDVVVGARKGLVAQQVGGSRRWDLDKRRPKATRWRIVPASGGHSALQFKKGGRPWHQLARVEGTLQFAAGNRPIRLYLPHGASTRYRGVLRAGVPAAGRLDRDTVNVVRLEDYVRGVVPQEMPASWRAAAVRAQAVAARTYAAYERAHAPRGHYQICDTSSCQVYGGYDAEEAGSNAAVAATAHQIITWHGQPAFSQFSSSNGGYSLAGSAPYLVSQKDPYEKYGDNPYRTWTTKVTLHQVQQRWPSAGRIVSVTVHRDATHRYVDHVTIVGTKRTYKSSGDDFKDWAGLRSTWFGVASQTAR